MKIIMWGTRGSIPSPGPETAKYGGNTTCIELRFEPGNRLVIIDAGSGIRPLGGKIMGTDFKNGPIKAQIFVSHTHWDHIMGFPFFTPIYIPTTRLEIFGPVTFEDEPLDRVIGGQLQYRYFPVASAELAAQLSWHRLQETELHLGDGITMKSKYLNHPIACLGYRFTQKGKTLVTLFDHEPFRNLFITDPAHPDYDAVAAEEGKKVADEQNRKVVEFMDGADIVIHDAQYTHKEYLAGKLGWGHSSYEVAINSAAKAGVKTLVLTHHDPERTDAQLDELEARYREMARGKTGMNILFAREGMEL